MSGLDLVTQPSSEPVTVAQAKARIVVSFSDHDTIIGQMISEARSAVEAFLKQALLPTVYAVRFDYCFPSEIRLPVGPVRDADSVDIEYVNDAGATVALAATEFRVSPGMTGVIRPAFGKSWPSVQPVTDALTVTFTAGEALAADIRPAILSALYLEIGNRYAHRESVVVGVPGSNLTSLSAHNLLTPFVRHD